MHVPVLRGTVLCQTEKDRACKPILMCPQWLCPLKGYVPEVCQTYPTGVWEFCLFNEV